MTITVITAVNGIVYCLMSPYRVTCVTQVCGTRARPMIAYSWVTDRVVPDTQ
jgi:hypothetical protein